MRKTTRHHELSFKLLDRYVSSEFLFSYVVSTVVLLLLVVLIDLFLMFDEFMETSGKNEVVTAWIIIYRIIDYYGPKLAEYFRDLSGMMVLVAGVFSLTRMKRQNELTAVLASGVSLTRLIAPVIVLGVFLNLLMVVDQEVVLPHFADKLVRNHDEVDELDKISINFIMDQNGALLCAMEYDPEKQTLYDMVLIIREQGRMIARVTADRAIWQPDENRWRLEQGRYKPIGRTDDGMAEQPREYYQSDLTADYLWLQRNSGFTSLMSSSELNALLKRPLRAGNHAEALGEKHFRFTDPIINMVMLIMGIPLLVSRERTNTKSAIFLCFAGAGGCFMVTFACKLLIGGSVPILSDPLLAAWLPIIIFVPVSVLALDELKT